MEPELPAQPPANNNAEEQKQAAAIDKINGGQFIKRIRAALAGVLHDDFFRFLTSFSIGFWMIHELVPDAHNIFLYAAYALAIADGFFVLAHKILPGRWWIKFPAWTAYIACLVVVFAFKNEPKSTDDSIPKLSTEKVRLGDGNNAIQSAVHIFNPNDFPVYDVALQFHILGNGVRADTVNIKMPDEDLLAQKFPPQYQIIVTAYTLRYDLMQEPTNQNTVFSFGWIGAKEMREIEVAGTLITNSFAVITLKDFKTNPPEIFRNSKTTTFLTPAEMILVRGIPLGNPATNIIIMGTVTNYPVEENGKWHHWRMGVY